MITNKFTAYGLTVAVAFAAAVVLLFASAATTASADKGTPADAAASVTTSGAEANNAVTLKSTHIAGAEACIDGTFATSSVTNATASTPTNPACVTITTTINSAAAATDKTLTVVSTTGFPDSGALLIDDDGDADTDTGGLEVVTYTGKTTTSFTGVVRAAAGSTGLPLTAGDNVWPAVFSQITIVPMTGADTTVNMADGSGIVVSATAELIFDPGGANEQVEGVSAKFGNTLIVSSNNNGGFPVGEYAVQIHGVNTDTGVTTITPTSGATEASLKYTYTAGLDVSTAGTLTLTIVSNNPDAVAAEVKVSATLPTPIPIIVPLVGSDSSEISIVSGFTFTKLPTKGILGTPTTALCTNVALAKVGEVMTNCLSQVVYTPLLGATGNDTFDYTLVNGVETSAAATVNIVLPGGTGAVTPGQGFAKDPLNVGFNITTYNGGTVEQLGIDAAAPGATTIAFTVDGKFVIYVVGAPAFVNQAVVDAFTGGIPAGEGVVIVVAS